MFPTGNRCLSCLLSKTNGPGYRSSRENRRNNHHTRDFKKALPRGWIKNLSSASLDIFKAFDSVSHDSIIKAAASFGASPLLNKYVSTYYSEATCVFEGTVVHAQQAMDEALGDTPFFPWSSPVGPLDYLAFADDVILFAEDRTNLEGRLANLAIQLETMRLSINSTKSACVSVLPDGRKKRNIPDDRPLTIAFSCISSLPPTDDCKFLGVPFDRKDKLPTTTAKDLDKMLRELQSAPLKPQQRIDILRFHLLPKLDHALILSDVHKITLRSMDLSVRSAVLSGSELGPTIWLSCRVVVQEALLSHPAELKQLLYFCTHNIQFKFDGELYRQIDGVAMGSPLGPLFADTFMVKLENDQLEETIRGFTVYKRYVDDTICIVGENTNPTDVLAIFNSVHTNVTFTIEAEHNDQLAFLDVLIQRRADGSIQRKIYRKGTWNGQYIHFGSFVPLRQKRNLINCMTNRAMGICTWDTVSDELTFLRTLFLQNDYPERFVDKTMERREKQDKMTLAEKKTVFISLSFKGDTLAETITRRLNTAINRAFNAADLRCRTSKAMEQEQFYHTSILMDPKR
ncbi:uncharacterized protein DEA37_0002830 [Paragonimus westermani]|uniref:Reverse transcriptase domain-containing protein n=1 Tax=Paragonimus westermani TaxID=34504 RepID=A0A5J4NIA3_9TREM|nr:uncharacterized protein DEA37_0002830 [Paragonimus westermani]